MVRQDLYRMNRILMGKLVHTHGLGGELLTLGELLSKRKGYMTQDEIIEMADKADEEADNVLNMKGEYHPNWHQVRDEAFAKLVAEREREACANIVEENANKCGVDTVAWMILASNAEAIRARGNYRKGETD